MKVKKKGLGYLDLVGLFMTITGDACSGGGEKSNSQQIRLIQGWTDLYFQYYEFYHE